MFWLGFCFRQKTVYEVRISLVGSKRWIKGRARESSESSESRESRESSESNKSSESSISSKFAHTFRACATYLNYGARRINLLGA